MQLTWTFAHTTGKPFNRLDSFYAWNKEPRSIHLGARNLGYQRQPMLIHERQRKLDPK